MSHSHDHSHGHDDEDHEQFEREFWGTCVNTFEEDRKHFVYARCMGLVPSSVRQFYFKPPAQRILDIGGGPTSMLLKLDTPLQKGKVVDPLDYPEWTRQRYAYVNIQAEVKDGEAVDEDGGWDEVWIYNVLQHTHDPARIIANAKRAAPVLRIFEWIDIPPHPGHPHELTEASLNAWIGGRGATTRLNESGCVGRAYYGVFRHRDA
jgi:hypothetical protein